VKVSQVEANLHNVARFVMMKFLKNEDCCCFFARAVFRKFKDRFFIGIEEMGAELQLLQQNGTEHPSQGRQMINGNKNKNCPHQPTIKFAGFLPIKFLPAPAPPYFFTQMVGWCRQREKIGWQEPGKFDCRLVRTIFNFCCPPSIFPSCWRVARKSNFDF